MSEITVPLPDELLLDNLNLSSPTQVNRSTWTGRRKVLGGPGVAIWQGNVSISGIATEVDERQWRAFLFALEGPANWFRWPLPRNTHIGPKPRVATASGTGKSLALDGMTANTRILQAGQFITIPLPSGHARAVCLTADLVTNGTGQATAQFKPGLTETPADNAEVETVAPYIPMAPTDSVVGLATSQGVSATGFEVEEAL
ncbi:hypothetical protein INR77_08830 [Erythrobacter sp. SCSIO 43205]|uniref:hypothetical protein n=1 Tax=Erythrobacter sp. SCSIO 43205 TaxID=2779361 RepID=UPI001CA9C848|nr:hypothetical protein [Erythrobacter sp. SCSIO 43205]UAB76951.1 hypothetical protein INR77_08830 [Erythrobacter sp. SCSIO 43205]